MINADVVHWTEDARHRCARWRSATGSPPPKRIVVADDETKADTAYRLACEGTSLLWRGDFHNARQLIKALTRRVERNTRTWETFYQYRQHRAQRARVLGRLLVPLDRGFVVPLRRAPDVHDACSEVYGDDEPSVVSLRELLGVIGSHEWRVKGVEVPALGARIHPHYGVFGPTRSDYVDLVARAPLPSTRLAFDIGTGTGVLAAVLARRGVERVVATDQDPRALDCARENVARLGVSKRIDVVERDIFPDGRAPLVVCNPPWVPAKPSSPLERAVYDPKSRMLRGFLAGLGEHLDTGGEGWLILSDLAEHLGLRSRADLLAEIGGAGLSVIGREDTPPRHPRAADPSDPLHALRAAEVVSLWRLARAGGRLVTREG